MNKTLHHPFTPAATLGLVQLDPLALPSHPTTGIIRSNDTTEIALWMIDSDYDDESFFVRHCYFSGGGTDPYARLKRALRAEIDDQAWDSLYGTQSRPFPPPRSGKIAVKVINHYGDEVLKVFEIEN